MPGPVCPPQPGDALEECIRAARYLLTDTTQRHEKVPWIEPPYLARWECKHTQSVISTTVALNAATNAAGLLMLAANTYPGTPAYTPAILPMASTSDFQTVFTLEPQQGYMARIKSWGISAGPSGPKSIQVRVRGSTAGGTPTAPDPFLGSFQSAQQQDTFVILQSKQALSVEVALRDVAAGPVLVDFGICYWLWPVNKRTDTPDGAILRSGYGLDCK
jgi:hypothetical protein